jgi:hypothetical protein
MKATIPRKQQDTTIMGSDVSYAVLAEMLEAGVSEDKLADRVSQWK